MDDVEGPMRRGRRFCHPNRVVRQPTLSFELQVGGKFQSEIIDQLGPRTQYYPTDRETRS
jgi:hypothetical protein